MADALFSGMTSSGSGISQQETATLDYNDDISLPGYLVYLSLGFKLIATLITVLMASTTIKITKSLHKSHNIFVANLMIIDILMALFGVLASGSLTVASLFGVEDLISCKVFFLPFLPSLLTGIMYVMISVDKVTAIAFPFKYRKIMTPRTACKIIITSWGLAVLHSTFVFFFVSNTYIKVASYGICVLAKPSFALSIITYLTPVLVASTLTLILNVYLTIKAYQIRKQIQKESSLSGGDNNNQYKSLKKKQANLKKQMKPVITLLVIILGSVFIGVIFTILYVPAKLLTSGHDSLYLQIMDYLILPNLFFVSPLLHPFVYGVYFKLVREPMINCLKGMIGWCKLNSAVVAPQQ